MATTSLGSGGFDLFLRNLSSKIDKQNFISVTRKRFGDKYKLLSEESDIYPILKQQEEHGFFDKGDFKFLECLVEKSNNAEADAEMADYRAKAPPKEKLQIFGREKEVEDINKRLNNKMIRAVNLFGDSGVGKTTLAQEVAKSFCKSNEGFELKRVDLRETREFKIVVSQLLECFGLVSWDRDVSRLYHHLKTLPTPAFLLIDNVEQLLGKETETEQETQNEFISLIKSLLDSPPAKSGSLKIILTSRANVEEQSLRRSGFSEKVVEKWDTETSKSFMIERSRYPIQKAEDEMDALTEISELCKNNTYLVEGIAQVIREGVEPKEIIRRVTIQLSQNDIPEQFTGINLIFESLPTTHLKEIAIKVALFRKSFTVSMAQVITESHSLTDVNIDLEILAHHKLLTVKDADDKSIERTFDMHAIFHEFVDIHLSKSPQYQSAYNTGERHFFKFFTEKIEKLAKLFETDFVEAHKRLESDRPNYEFSLDIAKLKDNLGDMRRFLIYADEYYEAALTSTLFEALKDTEQRQKLYHEWAELAESEGHWLSGAQMRCWECIQEVDMVGHDKGMEVLNKAKADLKKVAKSDKGTDRFNAVLGLYYYCQGRLYWIQSEREKGKKADQAAEAGIQHLERSLEIRRQHLGDHTQTARTLNLIGNALMTINEPDKALGMYQEALEMKRRLVGSDDHWEMPTYYNQIAAVYERKATNEEKKNFFRRSRKKIEEYFTKAKEWYEKAIALQEELGVGETEHTPTYYRNLANTLIALKDYDGALRYAQGSYDRRKEQRGDHPETARILYLIGIIHEWRKDKGAALESYEEAFRVEETLPHNNHSVVWPYIIDRLTQMCEMLRKTDKLRDYKRRIREIEEREILAKSKIESSRPDESTEDFGEQAEEQDEQTAVWELTKEGGTLDLPSFGVIFNFPPDAVTQSMEIECVIRPPQFTPSENGESVVSNIVELGPNSLVLSKSVHVTLRHSVLTLEPGYEIVARQYLKDWEDLDVLHDVRSNKDLTNLGPRPPWLVSPCIQFELWRPATVAIINRLIVDELVVTPSGGEFKSRACADVQVFFPRDAVKKKCEGKMTRGRGEWEDITSEVGVASEGYIEYKVRHFSGLWPWVVGASEVVMDSLYTHAQSMLSFLARSPLLAAYVAAYHTGELQESYRSFRVKLVCVAHHRQNAVREENERDGQLLDEETFADIRAGDKLYPKLAGGLPGDYSSTKSIAVEHAQTGEVGPPCLLGYRSDPGVTQTEPLFCLWFPEKLISYKSEEVYYAEYFGTSIDEYLVKQDLGGVWIHMLSHLKLEDDIYKRYKDTWWKEGGREFFTELSTYDEDRAAKCFDAMVKGLQDGCLADHGKDIAQRLIKGKREYEGALKDHPIGIEKIFQCVAENLTSSWKSIGRKLQLGDAVLEQIHEDYKNVVEKCYQMLLHWQREQGSQATLKNVFCVLRKGRCTEASKALAKLVEEHQLEQEVNFSLA
ncbi:predicted protein [Nematostella vectensis]|uniref:Death domain-containing protein n=1 Tax=Nematostella vectensis TaxID=45351 RepID=A7SPE5_NEMVE|nr:predicted protein [Nematostella vectensis]|eukprot:XP_001626522.1 predicted protein [Nematostella vectensis]